MGHDNVAGSGFFPLHKIFQEQYENLFEAVDEIAERVRALVHRLICSWHMVAFKMGRRQGARRAHI
jgi:starvation-inducible DNA-binding protein